MGADQHLFLAGEEGRDVRDERFLVEVVLDDARDEIIHHLVIGEAGAEALAADGWMVVVSGRRKDALDAVRLWSQCS